jgi:tetratricopeptide (TPR) repeat protein
LIQIFSMNLNLRESTKPLLTLCMIVRNEEEHLSRCLKSASPYVDEIVIVDTGSSDKTVEIAANYGATIDYFEWCHDFARARNYALSKVTGAWVLVLDADEELVVSVPEFKAQLAESDFLAYSLVRNEVEDESDMTPLHINRLFRNLPEMQYVQRFHEQLKYGGQWLPESAIGSLSGVEILHHGNRKTQFQQKTIDRNIPILEQIRQEEGLSLMLLYCLAGMYADSQQPEKAKEIYAEAFEQLFPYILEGKPPENFSFVPSLMFVLASQALQQQDYETAQFLCQRGLEWCPSYPPLSYVTGALLRKLGFSLGAIAYFQNCIKLGKDGSYYKGEPFDLKYMTIYPACDMGNTYLHSGQWTDATQAFQLALSFDASCTIAQQNLEQLQQQVPSTL